MNRKSFVDLTALLDVMLILFFAALINAASSADILKEENKDVNQQLEIEKIKFEESYEELKELESSFEEIERELKDTKLELANLYGSDIEDLDDYKEILSKISMIDIMLVGNSNELWINNESTKINIIRERIDGASREDILKEDLIHIINLAIDRRDKSDIIFLKVKVKDREVYKYAYDYLSKVIDEIVIAYGKDKVMISREYD